MDEREFFLFFFDFFCFFFLWAFFRCHFPVCAKSCDVVFYCPSAFPGEEDYPFPFCSPECAASWAEYEIGDTIVWNPQFDVKPATATAIRAAIEARVQRSVKVRDSFTVRMRCLSLREFEFRSCCRWSTAAACLEE